MPPNCVIYGVSGLFKIFVNVEPVGILLYSAKTDSKFGESAMFSIPNFSNAKSSNFGLGFDLKKSATVPVLPSPMPVKSDMPPMKPPSFPTFMAPLVTAPKAKFLKTFSGLSPASNPNPPCTRAGLESNGAIPFPIAPIFATAGAIPGKSKPMPICPTGLLIKSFAALKIFLNMFTLSYLWHPYLV